MSPSFSNLSYAVPDSEKDLGFTGNHTRALLLSFTLSRLVQHQRGPLFALSTLRGLLRRYSSAVNVLVDIRSGVELPSTAVDAVLDLARSRGRALCSDQVVDAGFELAEGDLDVAALREMGA